MQTALPESLSNEISISQEMLDILKQRDYISVAMGGTKLRKLYRAESLKFNSTPVTHFARACFFGDLEIVTKDVALGLAPSLAGTETPFNSGYATLVVLGAQRVTNDSDPKSLRHLQVLKFLISRGLPVGIPDIVGITALAHAITSPGLKLDLARVLLEAKADVNYQNRYAFRLS